MFATAIVAILLTAGVEFFLTGLSLHVLSRNRRTKSAGNLPTAVAGRMTEFPVDTADTPARPSLVAMRSQWPGPNGRVTGPPPSYLPPKVARVTLARVGETIATAVVVGAAQVTRVRVECPKGQTYTGYRVNSVQAVTIILYEDSGGVFILIHGGAPAAKAGADRLASNGGNGGGLWEDPDIGPVVERQAASEAPRGFDLVESQAYFGENVDRQIEDLKPRAGVRRGPEANGVVEQGRSLLPASIVQSVYRDRGRGEFRTIVGEYGGTWKAMSVWLLLRGPALG